MKNLAVAFLIIVSLAGTAQYKADSLRQVWNNLLLADTIRLDAVQALAFNVYLSTYPDSTFYYSQQMYELAVKTGHKKFEADALNNQGVSLSIRGYYEPAIVYYERALAIYSEAGNTSGLANSYGNIGIACRFLGDYEKSLDYYMLCLEMHEKNQSKTGISKTYNNIANVYNLLGDYKRSLSYNFKSLAMKTELNDKKGMSGSYNNIGQIYYMFGKADSAFYYYDKSLEIRIKNNDRTGMIATYSNIGKLYHLKGEFEQALAYFYKALELLREVEDINGLAMAWYNISFVHYDLGEYDLALDEIMQSLELAKQLKNPESTRVAHRIICMVQSRRGNMSAAEDAAREFLAITNKEVSNNFPILSEREQQLYLANTISYEYHIFNSFALQRKNTNPAITGLVYDTALRNKGLLMKSSTAMRNNVLSSGDTALISTYNQWIRLRKEIVAAYNAGDTIADLEEKANALEKELVKKSSVFNAYSLEQSYTWQDVRSALQPGEAAIEFIHFTNRLISQDTITYCALIVRPGDEYPLMVELFEESELTRLVGTIQGNNLSYIEQLYGTPQNPRGALYELIWKPLAPYLENTGTLYLSPTGLLHRVSFHAISTGKNTVLCDRHELHIKSSTTRLISPEQFSFSDIEVASVFGGINYSSENAKHELWSYLDGTKTEAENIRDILSGKGIHPECYTGDQATEEKFKLAAASSSILHVATHGFFYPDPAKVDEALHSDPAEQGDITFRGDSRGYTSFVTNPNPLMRSGLVFAGANEIWNPTLDAGREDGILTAQELIDIDMRKMGLVVLSACETGLGDIGENEGVYGLQRAFKMAGVQFMIISLWQVPDKETSEFMTLFYKNLAKLKYPQKAFTKTQRTLRKKYNPYYWAAFVLVE
jgi:CHAT domain-containing protein/tetratricopeptide (TPR) repeat protein